MLWRKGFRALEFDCLGLSVGLGFTGLGFEVHGSGLRVLASGFRASGDHGLGLRVLASGFRVSGDHGLGLRVLASGFRASGDHGLGLRVLASGL